MAGQVEWSKVFGVVGLVVKGCAGCAVAAGLVLVALALAGNFLR